MENPVVPNSTPVQDAQAEYRKKMLNLARFRTLLSALMTLVLLFMGGFALTMGARLNGILNSAESTFTQLDMIATDINEADLPGMFDEINTLVQDGQAAASTAATGVEDALARIEKLDIETLNKTIQDFSAVVEPLSRLFGR